MAQSNKSITMHSLIIIITISLFMTACSQVERSPGPKDTQEPLGKEPTISLYIAEQGEKKDIKIEEYLYGVVAAEMEPTWPEEALAAQAILARTFTLERMKSTGGVPARGTDASTNVEEFQAYNEERINDRVKNAVKMTRGEVVKHEGQYIKAWFFADAGGVTAASAEEGLAYTKEPTPYIQSVKDPGFAITKPENKAWKAQFTTNHVREAIREVTGKDPGDISQLKAAKKGPSGRVMTFQVGNTTISGPGLRLALGSEKMRSTLLTDIGITGGSVVMGGKGFGHGVGMSQWGARALAEQGKSPEQIVQYFFKNVEIVKEWK